jgi:hypothetical protein
MEELVDEIEALRRRAGLVATCDTHIGNLFKRLGPMVETMAAKHLQIRQVIAAITFTLDRLER